MKKLFLVGALALFGAMNAQKFGAKVGANLSNFTGDVTGTESKVGFYVGGFANFAISDKFSFQPELVYSNEGAKANVEGINVTWNVDYIKVPLMFQYHAAEKFNLEAGPYVGFLVSSKAKASGESADMKDLLNSTDFGLGLGAEYNFTDKISAGLRYNAGLSNIAKDSGSDKVKNSVFQLGLGYRF